MRRRLLLCFCCVSAVLSSTTARGAVVTVTEGTWSAIKAAIQSAANGDTVRIADSLAGTTISVDNWIAVNKSLSIEGPADGVTIDGGGTGKFLYENLAGAVVRISNITFAKMDKVMDVYAGDLVVSNCTFRDGAKQFDFRGKSFELRDCIFSNCCYSGVGACAQTAHNATTNFVAERCSFIDIGGREGAALYLGNASGGKGLIKDCVFRGVYGAGTTGSGTVAIYGGPSFVLEGCEFSDLRGGDSGAAIYCANCASAVLLNCTLEGGRAVYYGGGFRHNEGSAAYFVNCTVAGNLTTQTSADNAGGIQSWKTKQLLNTVVAYNYRATNVFADVYTAPTATRSIYNTGANPYNYTPTAAAGEGDAAATKLFNSYKALSSISIVSNETVALASAIIVPVLNDDPERSRVVEIRKGGALDGAGAIVRANNARSYIGYSTDGGTTWTTLLGTEDASAAVITADQRGVPYSYVNGVLSPSIGAAAAAEDLLGSVIWIH